MTTDRIALTESMPDAWSLLAGLMSGGPDTTLDTGAEGALLRLCDTEGRPLATVEAPMLVRTSSEVERLLGVPADGPVWWTEVRAATGVEGAVELAGTAVSRLVARLGGRVWPAEAAAPDHGSAPVTPGTATAIPAAAQPAVDVLTETTAVVVQERPVVAMTAWLSDALRATAESERGLHLVTPDTSRLTLPTRTALSGPPNRWVVQDGAGGYYDGLSGARLRWQDGTFQSSGALAECFTSGDTGEVGQAGEETQLLLSFRTRQRSSPELSLGGALETVWEAVTGAPPAGWGTAEPAGSPWSRQQLTDFVRDRAPESTWLVAVGSGERAVVATHRTDVTTSGVEEDVTLALGYPAGQGLPLPGLVELAARLVAEHGLVSMLVQRRAARADLTVPARLEAPPIPLAFALGSVDMDEVGVERARSTPLPGAPVQLGPAGDAGFYYELPAPDPATAWEWLHELFAHLDVARQGETHAED
ncbi:DUF6177 family protein [Streptomyces oceani]|uniref:Uncharacterized protein n=1 Tax=Streptomyces oceani TaxID=1075402 RepID=A0A1E7KHU7_9ACTN|nr:DUF6177 family protein [Streptomyces oceani]OEV03424.1 hypothetical protein AN216_11145 [Streptomyces oceani]